MNIEKCKTAKEIAAKMDEVGKLGVRLATIQTCAERLSKIMNTRKGYTYEFGYHKPEVMSGPMGNRKYSLVFDYMCIRILADDVSLVFAATTREGKPCILHSTGNAGTVAATAVYSMITYTFAEELAKELNDIFVEHGEHITAEACACVCSNDFYYS